MDKKINAEQLEKDIDAIEGVCDEGKKGIKRLFENLCDVKFENIPKVKLGQVWHVDTGGFNYDVHVTALGLVCVEDGHGLEGTGDGKNQLKSHRKIKFIADSLLEYYAKKS